MRTTNKEFKAQVQEHILDILSTDETEVVSEQLSNVVEGFKNWYCQYNKKRIPNGSEAFKDWMLGLPSSLNIEYQYYTISQTLKKWFETCGATYIERDSDAEATLYYHLVTREFETLCEKNDVKFWEVI